MNKYKKDLESYLFIKFKIKLIVNIIVYWIEKWKNCFSLLKSCLESKWLKRRTHIVIWKGCLGSSHK